MTPGANIKHRSTIRRNEAEGQINLAQRRAWYADELPAPDAAPGGQQPQGETLTPEALRKELEEARKEAAKYRRELREFQETQRKASEAALTEQQQFKTLAEQRAAQIQQLEPYKAQYETMEQAIRDANDSRIKQVPEAMRSLIPANYAPMDLQRWLDGNWQLLTTRPAPQTDAGARGDGGANSVKLDAATVELARKMGISLDTVVKHNQ